MNSLDHKLTLVDEGDLKINENIAIDIQDYCINTDLYPSARVEIGKLINEGKAYFKIFLNNDYPKYVLCLYIGTHLIKNVSNIDCDSVRPYLIRYGIPLTDKIKIMI